MDFSGNQHADDQFHFYDQSLVTDIQADKTVKFEINIMCILSLLLFLQTYVHHHTLISYVYTVCFLLENARFFPAYCIMPFRDF